MDWDELVRQVRLSAAGEESGREPAESNAAAGEWEQHASQSKGGLLYYYNTRTGETSWYPPVVSGTTQTRGKQLGAQQPDSTPTADVKSSDEQAIQARQVPPPRLVTINSTASGLARDSVHERPVRHGEEHRPFSARNATSGSATSMMVDYPPFLSARQPPGEPWPVSVSYTHLTLPTILLV